MMSRICSERAAEGFGFQRLNPRAQIRHLERLSDRIRYLLDDLLRRTGRSGHAHPGIGIDARQRLGQGRDIGVVLEALAAAGGENFQLAGIDILFVGQQVIRTDVDISCQQIIDGGSAAPIRHLGHAEIALEHQKFAQEVSGIAFALVAIVDLAGIGLRVGDELGHVVGRQPCPCEHDQGIGRSSDRLDRPRVEGRLGEYQMGNAVGELGAHKTVYPSGGDRSTELGSHAAARAAGAVLDHDLLAEQAARFFRGETARAGPRFRRPAARPW